jgi:hypothetical protein
MIPFTYQPHVPLQHHAVQQVKKSHPDKWVAL